MTKSEKKKIIDEYLGIYELWNKVPARIFSTKTNMEISNEQAALEISDGVFLLTRKGSMEGPFYISDLQRFSDAIKKWIEHASKKQTTH